MATFTDRGTHDAKTSFTIHAIERFIERFPDEDMIAAFRRAIPFAGQSHGDTSMIDESLDAVFVMNRFRVIRTVLTRAQALANIQMLSGWNGKQHVSSEVIDKQLHGDPQAEAERRTREQIIDFARKHGRMVIRDREHMRIEEMRRSGIALGKKELKEYRHHFARFCKEREALMRREGT